MKHLILLFLCIILSTMNVISKPIQIPYTGIPHLDTALYYHNIGVVEKTGHNDGPYVKKFLAYVGLSEGYSWCAAFASYCTGVCSDIVNRIKTSMAQNWIKSYSIKIKDVVYGSKKIYPGWTADFRNGSTRYGHVEFVYHWERTHGQDVGGNVSNRVSFITRSYQPRNYERITNFTPIKYKDNKYSNIQTKWQPITDKGIDVMNTF